MRIVHTQRMPWGESLVPQRSDDDRMAHKRLFEGDEDSPDNYMLVLSSEPNSYFSPRHRHPWDQVRFCLDGKIPIAKGLFVEGGEIAYFPENTYYGPQEGGEDRHVLLLQFGGASGRGFIGPDRLKSARAELAAEGVFERGVYTVATATGKRNTDAYEAIWRHVKGNQLDYSAVLYKTPIVIRPSVLPWRSTSAAGCELRDAGAFPHRGLAVRFHRQRGAQRDIVNAETEIRFLFVTDGGGWLDDEMLERGSAVEFSGTESVRLGTDDHIEYLELVVARVAGAA